MGHDPTVIFGITVHKEQPRALDWCLRNIRAAYPTAPIFVCTDGTDVPGFVNACAEHSAEYLPGERLKLVERGAAWWGRFFGAAIKHPGEYIFKIDPDTKMHRAFQSFPVDADVFGSVETTGNLQGGIQGFTRATVERIVESGVCEDPIYKCPAVWAGPNGIKYVQRTGQTTTDGTLRAIIKRMGLRQVDWPEVHSLWSAAEGPFREGVAATHPHKNP